MMPSIFAKKDANGYPIREFFRKAMLNK